MKCNAIKPPAIAVLLLMATGSIGAEQMCGMGQGDNSLVVHYRFDSNPNQATSDLSGFGNDGKIVDGEYLPEVNGRRGVLRFNGKTAYIDCGNSESMQFAGDMTFEMWVRFNEPMNVGPRPGNWQLLYGEYPSDQFAFQMPYPHTLAIWYRNFEDGQATWLPVDPEFINQTWSHIAVVIEYPRCRFYKNGQLYHDAYMPLPGVRVHTNDEKYHQHIGGGPDGATYGAPIDLTEFRLYRRALSAEEVAAHAAGEELVPSPSVELAVEPNWYKDQLTLRMTVKGGKYKNKPARFWVRESEGGSIASSLEAEFSEVLPGGGRYVATTTVALSSLKKNASYEVTARIEDTELQAARALKLEKPAWVHSQAGISDEVLVPWTPVTTAQGLGKTVDVGVWGRNYHFDTSPFVGQIKVHDAPILSSSVTLNGQVDGKPIKWKGGRARLIEAGNAVASLDQKLSGGSVDLHVKSHVEYDGFITIECELKATRDTSLDELTFEIPLRSEFAQFCGGDYVLPKKPNVSMSAMYRGAVQEDLSFQFGPSVWLGTEAGGLCWQSESDEDWHYADKRKAIEILPRGETTYFRAHFVDVPTKLAEGETLHYKFALQATPIKPLYRDAWSMRIARSEPFGADLDLPNRTIQGEPAMRYLADRGVRYLFCNVNDDYPWPIPRHEKFSASLQKLNEAAHDAGLKTYFYMIQTRIPLMVSLFDGYVDQAMLRPMRQYMPGMGGYERPGPVTVEFGAGAQGVLDFCSKSAVIQDAYVHALAERLSTYEDDGIFLDGTCDTVPCHNTAHGCGYVAADGVIRPTYPVFAAREFMRRINQVVHQNKADSLVVLHSSFLFNVSAMAYSDVIQNGQEFTYGNQWLDHVASVLTLDRFRTQFTGLPLGLASEVLPYRLGPPTKVAATSLLHDISPWLRSNWLDPSDPNSDSYGVIVPSIWKLREEFDIAHAEKLFYFENEEYVSVSSQKCYATLFKHPEHGVLAIVSNLSTQAQEVAVQFNLDKLGLAGLQMQVTNPLAGESVSMTADGVLSIPLESEAWLYLWLRPKVVN